MMMLTLRAPIAIPMDLKTIPLKKTIVVTTTKTVRLTMLPQDILQKVELFTIPGGAWLSL